MIQNKDLKRRIVEISYKLSLSHIGSCLTAVDIIDEIYKFKKPDEKFVLSAGHAHLAHLVVMEKYGIINIDKEQKNGLEILINNYGIHCDRRVGCDASTGSLGHGIGIAVGMALADRSKNVYCLLSDGELAEGSVWEALRIVRELKLENLKIYLNFNGWGAYRKIDQYFMPVDIKMQIEFTTINDYPEWLQGQLAHYKTLDMKEYEEVMDLLK